MSFDLRSPLQVDSDRYRFLRDEEVNTDPFYYPFWKSFDVKLCREGAMDKLIDEWVARKWRREHP